MEKLSCVLLLFESFWPTTFWGEHFAQFSRICNRHQISGI
jgi:hypothetical protein